MCILSFVANFLATKRLEGIVNTHSQFMLHMKYIHFETLPETAWHGLGGSELFRDNCHHFLFHFNASVPLDYFYST